MTLLNEAHVDGRSLGCADDRYLSSFNADPQA
jgi:hypothetical protein